MKNRIRILFQDYNNIEASGAIPLQEDWNLARKEKISYLTHKSGFEAAEEAFHIFNAPQELLPIEQKMILEAYDGPSLSVGDIVEVYPEEGSSIPPKAYLCASIGWQEALIQRKDVKDAKEIQSIPRGTPLNPTAPAPPPKRSSDRRGKDGRDGKDQTLPRTYTPITEPKIKYKGMTCLVDVNIYQDQKSMCLRLVDHADGSPITTATVNVPEITQCLPQNHVLIKNYSESKPDSPDQYSLVDCLEKANIGKVTSAWEINEYGSEVFEMQITDPWILNKAEEKRKEIKIKQDKSPNKSSRDLNSLSPTI
jgi:hypothetical protein